MNFEQKWLEYDYNPFILFSSKGKVLSLNTEAQYLLDSTNATKLYELATTYASYSFGFKTTFLNLVFGRHNFFALTVGYEDEEKIGVKFYQVPLIKIDHPTPTGELTNIYTVVDLCIATNSINSNTHYKKNYDPTIPEIRIDVDKFLKLLNTIYLCFENNDKVDTKIHYRVGEYIKSNDKKYTILSIEIAGDIPNKKHTSTLENFVKDANLYIDIQENITINIPMIME